MALLYKIATDDQVAKIGSHFSPGEAVLVEASPLYFGYVAEGLIKRGLTQNALDLIRARFRDMLNSSDNPTIWECWEPFTFSGSPIDSERSYRHPERLQPSPFVSLVHTGGVLTGYVLSTRILGIRPTAPGFSKCVIHPRMGDLKWAKGMFPSPRGEIRVEVGNEAGKFVITAELPQGISAEVMLDREKKKRQTLSYSGTHLSVISLERLPRKGVTVMPDQIRIQIEAGVHRIELSDNR